MTKYRLRSDREFASIHLVRVTLLGERLLQKFSKDDFQDAMEHTKKVAAANRPSRVSLINTKGETTKQWDYKRLPKPKVYENKPRKNI